MTATHLTLRFKQALLFNMLYLLGKQDFIYIYPFIKWKRNKKAHNTFPQIYDTEVSTAEQSSFFIGL